MEALGFTGRTILEFFQSSSPAENQLVEDLAQLCRRLRRMEDGRVDTRSEVGYLACVQFLAALDKTQSQLRVEAYSRDYRLHFATNYRVLFADPGRNYRVDVLEGSLERHASFWVNGERFELNANGVALGEELDMAWESICAMLSLWSQSRETRMPMVADIKVTLKEFDAAWVAFEEHYIKALMAFEATARGTLMEAVQAEAGLRALELRGQPAASPECREQRRLLVACLTRLNAVANMHSRRAPEAFGRDHETLEGALAAVRRCNAEAFLTPVGLSAASGETEVAVRVVAGSVINAFEACRSYLRQVASRFDSVDPHLLNNRGLVSHLQDWDMSLEVGFRYVQQPGILEDVCDCISKLRMAQRWWPSFAKVCEACDAELFLVMPRIVWLSFFSDSTRHHLLQSLLPHRFASHEVPDQAPIDLPDATLKSMVLRYQGVLALLAATRPRGPAPPGRLPVAEAFAWRVLLYRAVMGHQQDLPPHCPLSAVPPQLRQVAESLFRDLEQLSLELQRHRPEEWNKCTEVFARCLGNVFEPKKRTDPFEV